MGERKREGKWQRRKVRTKESQNDKEGTEERKNESKKQRLKVSKKERHRRYRLIDRQIE